MSSSSENEAVRIGNALNGLGHLATGQSLEEIRRSSGDARLRALVHESATLLFEMVGREERTNPKVVPRSQEAMTALSHVRDLVRSVDWDDAESTSRLRQYARQALEALGFGLPE
ncbi:hypothetical protein [Hyalangium rubrum]|uniref:Uncharacterized protein n=1 Tax=Hyalangium rubrum TaxID=3103134 RepID=A0ABU5HCX8_9BACT|nr:hypothetical protein [Hyalangium sp. s54d21]MDY7231120.1 hypothetical protein [Hyalangium sp. s54d21]